MFHWAYHEDQCTMDLSRLISWRCMRWMYKLSFQVVFFFVALTPGGFLTWSLNLIHSLVGAYLCSGQVLWNEIRHESSLHCVLAFGWSTFEARSAGSSAIKTKLSHSQASDSGTKIERSSFGNELICLCSLIVVCCFHIFTW